MRRATREGHAEAVVLKLVVATLATLVATGVALVPFVDAIGTIGLMVIGAGDRIHARHPRQRPHTPRALVAESGVR